MMKQSLTQLVMNDFFIIGTQDMKLTQLMKMIIEQSEYIYIYIPSPVTYYGRA